MDSPEQPDLRRPWSRISLTTGTSVSRDTRRAEYPALPPRLGRGDRLGDLTLEEELACGANSSVYRAAEISTRRQVAVKVLSSNLSLHPEAVGRFRAESALAERVHHASILPIFGRSQDRGYHYYVMRLESGNTLEDCSTEATLHKDEAFYVSLARRFACLARALHEVHESSIVHRDVKPANVLLDGKGRYVLTDFGSALDTTDRDRLLEDTVGGTVVYMSPEQLRPGADPYDPAGDIYSLGLTLYEVCTGSLPFPHASDTETARLKLTRVPQPPRRLNHHIPLGLEAIIRQAIETFPQLRHPSAESMARDLERFAERKRASCRGLHHF
ncbi:MAG: serine/threonine-protein kinase [Planctomycetota bacterium]|nr:serine/threonine-protein kinase [Planctomycetota bacterium]